MSSCIWDLLVPGCRLGAVWLVTLGTSGPCPELHHVSWEPWDGPIQGRLCPTNKPSSLPWIWVAAGWGGKIRAVSGSLSLSCSPSRGEAVPIHPHGYRLPSRGPGLQGIASGEVFLRKGRSRWLRRETTASPGRERTFGRPKCCTVHLKVCYVQSYLEVLFGSISLSLVLLMSLETMKVSLLLNGSQILLNA